MQLSYQNFGVQAMGQLNGWEHYGAYAYGDYFPPEEGWTSFDQMVQNILPGRLWFEPSALYLDNVTGLYKSGTMNSSAMLDQQGNQRTTASAGADGGQWVYMDFSTDPWRQYIVGMYQTLATHGVDLIQLDSSMVMGPQICYNPAHSHPPGDGGNWQTLAWIDITQKIAAAVAGANPNAALSAEEPAEVYLPYLSLHSGGGVDEFENQFLSVPNQEPVPLFQYVYHDSILFADWFGPPVVDGSYFRLALARDLTWGQMPQYAIDRFPSSLDAAAQTYLQAAITARTTYAKKFLVDGIMLPPPQLSVPTTPATWAVYSYSQNNTQTTTPVTGQYPSIQESAWRASDGSIGIVLTNIAPNSVTFSLPISYSRLGPPSGAAYTVQSTGGSSPAVLDSNLVKDSAYSITVTPQQILLVTLTPKAPQPQINAGGAVMHASASTTVSPGSLFDIYGANLASTPASAPPDSPVLPSILGNVQVLVNGIPAPLLYVGPAQIVAQIPDSTMIGTASVVVLRDGAASAAASITVQQAAPSILTYGANRAIVQNQNYSLNSSANPAQVGSYAVAYLIGSGPVSPAVIDGVPVAATPLSRETLTTTVTVGGMQAQVPFAGMAPGFVGLVQIDFQVPDLPAGDYPIQVAIGTAQSNTAIMTIGR
jgi:uncharacterized protein (TIGR03437 family)